MRFKTFAKITTVTWCCAFLGGFITGKSAFGEIFKVFRENPLSPNFSKFTSNNCSSCKEERFKISNGASINLPSFRVQYLSFNSSKSFSSAFKLFPERSSLI